MQVFAPPVSYHAVLYCSLCVLSRGCFLLVVKPAHCAVVPAHVGRWHAWPFPRLPALCCAVGVPQASSAHGPPWCCPVGLGFAPAVAKALPPGGGMPMRRLHPGYWLLPWSPAFWATLACCWLLYVLIKSSGNSWVKGKIENVTQGKL